MESSIIGIDNVCVACCCGQLFRYFRYSLQELQSNALPDYYCKRKMKMTACDKNTNLMNILGGSMWSFTRAKWRRTAKVDRGVILFITGLGHGLVNRGYSLKCHAFCRQTQ